MRHSDPAVAGRPATATAGRRPDPESNFCLFGHLKSIIDLDSQVPHGTLQFGVPKKQLNRPLGLLLHDDGPCRNTVTVSHVPDSQLYEIARSELTVYG